MLNNNFKAFFFGSTRRREFRETRRDWRHTDERWARSALARWKTHEIAVEIVREAIGNAERPLAQPVEEALVEAVLQFLAWEEIGQLEVDWETIKSDPLAAVRFRQMLARRRRWANDSGGTLAAFNKALQRALQPVIGALPEACWTGGPIDDGATFEVPLIELIDQPAKLIERQVFAVFDSQSLDRDLFSRARRTLERNLLVASGLPPKSDARENLRKLVTPTNQKSNISGTELTELYLKDTPFRRLLNTPVSFSIPDDVRFEHAVLTAGTGHGKTQFLQLMIHADLVAAQTKRRSVIVLDSQADMIARLVRLALFSPNSPGGLAGRLVLIDPEDIEFPVALNMFDCHLERLADYRPVDRERVLNGLIEVYENIFGSLLGAELTQKQGVIFRYLARLMILIPGATIHTLMQLMEDGKPFKQYMDELDGSARHFFQTEFFHPSFAATKKQILRRLWGVLATPAFERMFAQPHNKLDLFQAMQDGKIILINTAKSLLKTEGSQIFGRYFLAMLAQAALERATVDPADRTPTIVYVDEAQEYFDDTIATILNQARKQRVGLVAASQALDQWPPGLRAVLLANTSMKCAGGVSARDARALAEELHTGADFIETMRKRGDSTEFAVWLKNHTPRAIRLSVPLGFLERQPIMVEEEYEALLAANRRQYCGTLADAAAAWSLSARPASEIEFPSASSPMPTQDRPGAADRPLRPRNAAPVQVSRPVAAQSGKGGSQHKYVQQLIKQLAEERGLRAVIEESVEGGQIDVGLHQGDLSIACEISVTSTPQYEARNLAKCVQAGFVRIWAISPDSKRRRAIIQSAQARLAPEDFSRIEFLMTEELVAALDSLTVPIPEEKVVAGYRVTSTRKAISATEAKERRTAIARILRGSTRETER